MDLLDGHEVLDITERKRMEQLWKNRVARAEAQKIARTGHLTIDLSENTVRLSEECSQLIELSAGEDHRGDDLLALVHPADRDEVRWVRQRGRPLPDEDGRTDRIFGVLTDVADQKRRATERRERESKIEALYDLELRTELTAPPIRRAPWRRS